MNKPTKAELNTTISSLEEKIAQLQKQLSERNQPQKIYIKSFEIDSKLLSKITTESPTFKAFIKDNKIASKTPFENATTTTKVVEKQEKLTKKQRYINYVNACVEKLGLKSVYQVDNIFRFISKKEKENALNDYKKHIADNKTSKAILDFYLKNNVEYVKVDSKSLKA